MTIDPIIETGKSSAGKTDFHTTHSIESLKGLKIYIKNINKIKRGQVLNVETDGKIIGKNPDGIEILLNYVNAKNIVLKHGLLPSGNLAITFNRPSKIIKVKREEGKSEKLNYIKEFKNGFFVGGANRINGYAVVTFFEPHTGNLKDYYKSLLKRGKVVFDFSERTAVPPFATSPAEAGFASQPSLSGVRKTTTRILPQKSNKKQ